MRGYPYVGGGALSCQTQSVDGSPRFRSPSFIDVYSLATVKAWGWPRNQHVKYLFFVGREGVEPSGNSLLPYLYHFVPVQEPVYASQIIPYHSSELGKTNFRLIPQIQKKIIRASEIGHRLIPVQPDFFHLLYLTCCTCHHSILSTFNPFFISFADVVNLNPSFFSLEAICFTESREPLKDITSPTSIPRRMSVIFLFFLICIVVISVFISNFAVNWFVDLFTMQKYSK